MDLAQVVASGAILARQDGTQLFRVKRVHNLLDKTIELVECFPDQGRHSKVGFLGNYRFATKEECLEANLPYVVTPPLL